MDVSEKTHEQLPEPKETTGKLENLTTNYGPLADLTKACLADFDTICALLLSEKNHLPLEQLNYSTFNDEYGRFKVWAGNIGALQRGPASLDERLRSASDVKYQASGLLTDLRTSLEQVVSIASGERPQEIMSIDDTAKILNIGSDFGSAATSSSTASEGTAEDIDTPKTEVQELFRAIVNSITALFVLSLAIRSSSTRARFTKSTDQSSIDDKYDVAHVWERFPAARKTPWLINRLGKAITIRRQFFRYRREHRARLASELRGHEAETKKQQSGQAQPISEAGKTQPRAPTVARSETTQSQAPTAATPYEPPANDEKDETETIISESSASSNNEEGRDVLRLPPPPLEYLDGKPFECQYCFTIQKLKPTDPTSWKRHLFRDLEPYTCTGEQCEFKSFSSKREWFAHEMEKHRNEFVCCTPGCNQHFAKRSSMESHFRSTHAGSFTEAQLPFILETCSRPLEKIPATTCPLCDSWNNRLKSSLGVIDTEIISVTPRKFRNHLGRHLLQLALYSLPKTEKKPKALDENDSRIAQLRGLSDSDDDSDSDDSQRGMAESVELKEKNIKESKISLPLYTAALEGRHSLQNHLDEGGDLEIVGPDGASAVHQAAQEGNLTSLKLLYEFGANLDVTDKALTTPLHRAADRNRFAIAKWLIEHGADLDAVDKSGATPLRRAANKGHVSVMELLLNKGADINAQDLAGSTALHRAAERGHSDAVEMLLRGGANVDAINTSGETPLHKSLTREDFENVARLLLKSGADVDARKSNGLTALHDAAGKGRTDVAEFLVKVGSNVNATGPRSACATHRAIFHSQPEMVGILLKCGADVSMKDDDGWTALYAAAALDDVRSATFLLKHPDCDLEIRDNTGLTALHRAAIEGHSTMVSILARSGADVLSKDDNGKTPMESATEAGKTKVVDALRSIINSHNQETSR